MLHLLTDEHRQKVVLEYRKRVTVIFLLGVLILAGISMIFMTPAFFMTQSRHSEAVAKQRELDTELLQKDTTSTRSEKEVMAHVAALHIFDTERSLSEAISHIINEKPSGVSLRALIFTPGEGASMTIDIGGKADTRQSLVAYNDMLKKDPYFARVIVPLSSFAKERDIDFSIKLILNP